jgi:hypothetical protein
VNSSLFPSVYECILLYIHPLLIPTPYYDPPLMKYGSEKKTTAYMMCDEEESFPNYCLVPISKIVLA